MAVFVANGSGIGAWAAAIPALQRELALGPAALSVALLAFAAGAVIAMPLTGLFSPRLGSARAARLALLAFACALLTPLAVDSLATLALAALLLGMCNGTMDVSMNAHASNVEARWGRPIMSSFHAGFSLGGLAGALLGASAASLTGSARGGVLVASAIAGLLGLAAWPVLRRDRSRAPRTGKTFVLPGRAMLPLAGAAVASMVCEGAMADWSGVYLASRSGVAATAALGYAAFSAAMIGGRLAGDAILRAIGARRALQFGGLIAAAGLLLAVLWPIPAPVMIGLALVGLGLANVVPAVFSAAGRLATTPALGVAAAATAGYAGFLTGPVVIGGIAEAAGLRAGLALLIVAALALPLLAAALPRHRTAARETALTS